MIQRCTNPKAVSYPSYGGRGISVCARWRTFQNFVADMGLRPAGTSIERVNQNGNYEPGNCRWATPKEQARNTSRSIIVSIDGAMMCLKDWAQENGVRYNTIVVRLARGWDLKEALTVPINHKGRRFAALTDVH